MSCHSSLNLRLPSRVGQARVGGERALFLLLPFRVGNCSDNDILLRVSGVSLGMRASDLCNPALARAAARGECGLPDMMSPSEGERVMEYVADLVREVT